ncbi:DNA-binding protein [Methylocystis sp.]|uniref:DNA-binding protein n=1 Tax=Methylocystis sp. TaxID=1911079 RepID=UPI0027353B4A|nr:DNA-binding protein [Methylocystis sp.]MDP3552644.1 DNA-binding protein [Methylocystis sp.]
MNPTQSETPPRDYVLSHGVESLPAKTGLGRTFIFGQIKVGALKARKAGRRTLVTDADLREWLASLPRAGKSNVAA